MPIHDWSRTDAGSFHDFHTAWIIHMRDALNQGILPDGYSALSEQVVTRMQTDVLALRSNFRPPPERAEGGLALLEAPPAVGAPIRPDPQRRPRLTVRPTRRLAIHHNSGQAIVAVIEIVSPANKDRRDSVSAFTTKVTTLLEFGVCVLVIDLLPHGRHDPRGMHGAVWRRYDTTPYAIPPAAPLMFATYNWAGQEPTAYLEPTAVGRDLIDMPLFLRPDRYVNVPLDRTYMSAYRGSPGFVRELLESPPAET